MILHSHRYNKNNKVSAIGKNMTAGCYRKADPLDSDFMSHKVPYFAFNAKPAPSW